MTLPIKKNDANRTLNLQTQFKPYLAQQNQKTTHDQKQGKIKFPIKINEKNYEYMTPIIIFGSVFLCNIFGPSIARSISNILNLTSNITNTLLDHTKENISKKFNSLSHHLLYSAIGALIGLGIVYLATDTQNKD